MMLYSIFGIHGPILGHISRFCIDEATTEYSQEDGPLLGTGDRIRVCSAYALVPISAKP